MPTVIHQRIKCLKSAHYVPGPILLTVTSSHHAVSAGPASRACDPRSHTEPGTQESPKLGLMLCRCCLEMPNHF